MNKTAMIDAVVMSAKMATSDVTRVLNAYGDVAAAELLGGGEVPIPGVGKLVTAERAARKGRNPQTGEEIIIPARKAIAFRPTKDLKAALAG